MFYSNLNYIDMVIFVEVNKHWIWLSLKEFTGINNLPYTGSNYDGNEEGKDFDFLTASTSFMPDLNSTFLLSSLFSKCTQIFVWFTMWLTMFFS